MAKLRFTRWVPDDLDEALNWYDSKSTVLSARFRVAEDDAFNSDLVAPRRL